VGRILQAVLPGHDSTAVEIFCYATTTTADQVAGRLCKSADHWRSIVHLSDDAAAELIRGDEIDLLIDLSGHTGANRLLVLARKPAPVQALWLGYFDTTGMSSIDYIIADHFVCLKNDERFYVEKIARLPHSFFCYGPPDPSPEVSPLPMQSQGNITLGSLNNLGKITPEVIALWATILRAIPDARLLLKYFGFDAANVREHFTGQFAEHGVVPERLTIWPPTTRST
jgi:predicted O-linked N-acetylglucosamine transferase (SPINDLY family)